MTVSRGGFSELLAPGLAEVFFHDIETWQPKYKEIVNVKGSKRNKEEALNVVGLGTMDAVSEGISTPYDDIYQGWKDSKTHTTFRKGVRITQEMIEDDQYDVMKNLVLALARSARQRVEVDAADMLNNAFSSSFTGLDGVSLVNASHVLKIGGTQSNALSAHADLTPSSLQEAIQVLEDCKDERGLNIALRAKLLVVPTGLQFTAAELLESVQKPGTMDNEINALANKGLTYTYSPYLTDTDAWFVLADEHKLTMWDRVPLGFFKGNDFDTFDCKFSARMRYSMTWLDWRGITGDQGV
jgi:phage major head subunit gpT-like protein